MKCAIAVLCGLLLSPHAVSAENERITLTAHIGVLERTSFFRLYSSVDKPLLFGGELTIGTRPCRFGIGLDVAHGRSSDHGSRRSLTMIAATVLYQPHTGARVAPIVGVGGVLRMERTQFVAFGGTHTVPMARGRAGAAIRLTRQAFVQPEVIVDASPGFDFMATARVGIGWMVAGGGGMRSTAARGRSTIPGSVNVVRAHA
jgi:hypothetical protein